MHEFQIWIPYHSSGLCTQDYPVCCIFLSFTFFSPDNMHQTHQHRIYTLSPILCHHSITIRIIRFSGQWPHRLITPVTMWMEWWHCSDLKLELNVCKQCNSPADTVFCLLLTTLIKYPKTPCAVSELAIVWWFRSGCQGIIWNKVDIASNFQLVNTCIRSLVGEIDNSRIPQVHQFELHPIYIFVDGNPESHCDCGQCDCNYCFQGGSNYWISQS